MVLRHGPGTGERGGGQARPGTPTPLPLLPREPRPQSIPGSLAGEREGGREAHCMTCKYIHLCSSGWHFEARPRCTHSKRLQRHFLCSGGNGAWRKEEERRNEGAAIYVFFISHIK